MARESALHSKQVTAALAIGTVGVLMLGIQPILLGALVDAHNVSLEGVGLVAMAEIIAIGCGVVVGDKLLSVEKLRSVLIVASVLLFSTNAVTMSGKGDAALIALRACAGITEGILVWGATAIIVRTANPGRTSAVFFLVQTLAQALFSAILATAVIPAGGWTMAFGALSVTALLALILVLFLPASLQPIFEAGHANFAWSLNRVRVLLIVFLQLAALGVFWAYIEPLGQAAGLSEAEAHALVFKVLVLQVIGSGIALSLPKHSPVRTVLMICSAAFLLIMLVQLSPLGGNKQIFLALSMAIGFFWSLMLPLQIAHAFHTDPSGRLAGLVPAAQLLGSAFGPLTASLAVSGDDARHVPILSVGYALLPLILLAVKKYGIADLKVQG